MIFGFGNKQRNSSIDDRISNIKSQMETIDTVCSSPHTDIDNDWMNFRGEFDEDIISAYHYKTKNLAMFARDNKDLKGIVHGNGEWYGMFQRNYEKCKKELEAVELHLKIEKDIYQKLYEQNRELETKLYMAQRELEILKGEVK
jgi:hypothetical protein